MEGKLLKTRQPCIEFRLYIDATDVEDGGAVNTPCFPSQSVGPAEYNRGCALLYLRR